MKTYFPESSFTKRFASKKGQYKPISELTPEERENFESSNSDMGKGSGVYEDEGIPTDEQITDSFRDQGDNLENMAEAGYEELREQIQDLVDTYGADMVKDLIDSITGQDDLVERATGHPVPEIRHDIDGNVRYPTYIEKPAN